MAWVTQTFEHGHLEVDLFEDSVVITSEEAEEAIGLQPKSSADAHSWAMMLRRAARRLEEIGKGLN